MIKKVFYILFLLTTISFGQNNQNLENKFRLAKSYEDAGDFEKAESYYFEIYKQAPWNSRYVEGLNNIYLRQKKYNQSVTLLQDRINRTPQDINAYGLLGSTYYQMGEREMGDKVWDEALEKSAVNIVSYRILANYAIQERAYLKAIDVLKTAQHKLSDESLYAFDIAYLYSVTMKYTEAAEEFCKLLIQQPQNIEAVKNRMSGYLGSAQALDASLEAVKNVRAENSAPVLMELLTFLYIQKKDYSSALNLSIEQDEASIRNGSKIYGFAQIVLKESAFEIASKAFQYIIDNYPNSPFASTAKLGFAESEEGKLDEKYTNEDQIWKTYFNENFHAKNEYLKIVKAYEDFAENVKNPLLIAEAHFRAGLIYLHKLNDLEKAQNSFAYVILDQPSTDNAADCMIELANAEIKRNDLEEAESYLNKLLKNPRIIESKKNEANFLLGRISFWRGNFDNALKKLSLFNDKYSDNFANNAIELSLLITVFKNDSLNLAEYAHAELAAEQDSFRIAMNIFKQLSENDKLFILKDAAKVKYAEMLLAENEIPLALAYLQNLAEEGAENIYSDNAEFLLANTYFYGVRDFKKAKEVFQSLLEKYPNSIYVDKSRDMINEIDKNGSEEI